MDRLTSFGTHLFTDAITSLNLYLFVSTAEQTRWISTLVDAIFIILAHAVLCISESTAGAYFSPIWASIWGGEPTTFSVGWSYGFFAPEGERQQLDVLYWASVGVAGAGAYAVAIELRRNLVAICGFAYAAFFSENRAKYHRKLTMAIERWSNSRKK